VADAAFQHDNDEEGDSNSQRRDGDLDLPFKQ
jgi:hypothetical protein